MDAGYKTYLVEYYHEGSWWSLEIPATCEEDVRKRLLQIRNAKVLGTVELRVPVSGGFFVKTACWVQNLFRRNLCQ